jgi:hypothetical protein
MGTHDELLKNAKGIYYHLHRLQQGPDPSAQQEGGMGPEVSV